MKKISIRSKFGRASRRGQGVPILLLCAALGSAVIAAAMAVTAHVDETADRVDRGPEVTVKPALDSHAQAAWCSAANAAKVRAFLPRISSTECVTVSA